MNVYNLVRSRLLGQVVKCEFSICSTENSYNNENTKSQTRSEKRGLPRDNLINCLHRLRFRYRNTLEWICPGH